jgi:flagellin
LESTDGSDVTIERSNLSAASGAFGTDADLAKIGFREVSRSATGDAYTVTGAALGATETVNTWGENDVKINGVKIYDANIATNSFQGKLDAINAKSDSTGVVASAFYEQVFDFSTFTPPASNAEPVTINGYSIVTGADLAAFTTNINAITSDTGITALQQGTNLVLSGSNVINLNMAFSDSDGATGGGGSYGAGETGFEDEHNQTARIRLDSINNTPISIELSEAFSSQTVATTNHGFLEMNVGASDYDVNAAMFSANSNGNTAGLSISTTADATKALTSLDAAIETVSSIRGDLGALQNRLDHTVNNLSSVANNTEGAKSRIVDTDFATETANLTKQQILSQAATSMLAQANQSKQGILALLQG